ncbi:MAG: hypothetical protein AB7L90_08820 [Hyphomicrobiaceae bacterium]
MACRQIAALFLAALVAGCAAAVPGYQPPTPKLEKLRNSMPKGGGFDDTGSYHLTDQELALDCKRLNGSITIKIKHMRASSGRVQPSVVASSAQAVTRPLVGGTTYGQNISADLRRDRARLDALNRQLAEKKCPTYDLDAELAQGNDKPPRPIKGGKKS